MESTYTIFLATLRENKSHPHFLLFVKELCCELSRKKIHKLKDEKHIQDRLGELFELYSKALKEESLNSPRVLHHVIEGLLKAASYEQETYLYKMIYEKEQLEKNIFAQKQSIRHTITDTFTVLEQHIQRLPDETKEIATKALHDAKLRGIEMLGILKETTQEALITTLEKGHDIQDTIHEITRNLSFQAISETTLTTQRALDIARTIVEASIEIADEELANARAILEGSIFGVRDGIAKAIDKFKNDLKFSPTEELEGLGEQDLAHLRKDLSRIEEYAIEQLKALATQSDGISQSIITEIIAHMNSSTAKIKRASNEAKEVISERIDQLKAEAEKKLVVFKKDVAEFEKIAASKLESFKHTEGEKAKQMAAEAKKLGFRAWEVAKSMMEGAVKGAQNAIKKEKEEDK